MCGENGEECKNAILWNIMLLVLCCSLALNGAICRKKSYDLCTCLNSFRAFLYVSKATEIHEVRYILFVSHLL